jgi:hypothetical protein
MGTCSRYYAPTGAAPGYCAYQNTSGAHEVGAIERVKPLQELRKSFSLSLALVIARA